MLQALHTLPTAKRVTISDGHVACQKRTLFNRAGSAYVRDCRHRTSLGGLFFRRAKGGASGAPRSHLRNLTRDIQVRMDSMGETRPAKRLLIVGPGVLGTMVGTSWLTQQGASVLGQTNTTTRHEELQSLGFETRVKEEAGEEKFPYVIFCAPPSGSEDYVAEITAAAKLWDGTGGFVFTSSSGVWPDDDDVTIFTEITPTKPPGQSPRTDKLLQAEQATLAAGGCVVRLAGLYHATRGAHMYFLKMGEVPSKGDSLLNLIHYKDAATLSVAALSSGLKEQIFMGCDNSPLTKIEMMEAVYASGRYGDAKCTFTITEGSPGRRMNNNATRAALTWQPEFASFQDFMEAYKAGQVDI